MLDGLIILDPCPDCPFRLMSKFKKTILCKACKEQQAAYISKAKAIFQERLTHAN